MKTRGQIVFWGAIISIPISLLSGDLDGLLMALGILGLAFVISLLYRS